jgi:hypothetical protein
MVQIRDIEAQHSGAPVAFGSSHLTRAGPSLEIS